MDHPSLERDTPAVVIADFKLPRGPFYQLSRKLKAAKAQQEQADWEKFSDYFILKGPSRLKLYEKQYKNARGRIKAIISGIHDDPNLHSLQNYPPLISFLEEAEQLSDEDLSKRRLEVCKRQFYIPTQIYPRCHAFLHRDWSLRLFDLRKINCSPLVVRWDCFNPQYDNSSHRVSKAFWEFISEYDFDKHSGRFQNGGAVYSNLLTGGRYYRTGRYGPVDPPPFFPTNRFAQIQRLSTELSVFYAPSTREGSRSTT